MQPGRLVLKKGKQATIGNYKVLGSGGGFTGWLLRYDSLYIQITADSMIWNDRGRRQASNYSWKQPKRESILSDV